MRTKQQIDDEIKRLKALKPTGPHKVRTQKKIDLMIDELSHGIDTTAEEFTEMSESDQDTVNVTREWKQGNSNEAPSTGWGGLVEGGE